MDFAKELLDLVKREAATAAEAVVARALSVVEDMQRRADALLHDADLAKREWEAARGLVDMIKKASGSDAGPFAHADFVSIGVLDEACRLEGAHLEFPAAARRVNLVEWWHGGPLDAPTLPAGRYTVVVSFYHQGTAA